MNLNLRKEIVRHIMSGFSIIPSNIDDKNYQSLINKNYLLDKCVQFEIEGNTINNKLWGCEFSFNGVDIKILLADCSDNPSIEEYSMIVSVKDLPSYGIYMIYHDNKIDEEMIGCSLNGKDWMECSTFLQATFLSAMEQIKDYGGVWSKCSSYEEQFSMMISFIKYHNSIYEADDEG